MLRQGPYPPSLQARIRSDYGHLGNDQAATLVRELDHEYLQWILLGHLSEQNNSDAIAMETISAHVEDRHERINVLAQHCSSCWFSIDADRSFASGSASVPRASEKIVAVTEGEERVVDALA